MNSVGIYTVLYHPKVAENKRAPQIFYQKETDARAISRGRGTRPSVKRLHAWRIRATPGQGVENKGNI